MAVSYKKLWKLLIDRDMRKKDLCAAAGISHASMAKLGKNENVTMPRTAALRWNGQFPSARLSNSIPILNLRCAII